MEADACEPVLYTNEVCALLSALVGALFLRAEPSRVRDALEALQDVWGPEGPDFEAFSTSFLEPDYDAERPADDPEDTPILRRVLYTAEVAEILVAFLNGVARFAPHERIREALEQQAVGWDEKVSAVERLAKGADGGTN